MAVVAEDMAGIVIKGRIIAGRRTKTLLPFLKQGMIALLQHSNLDVTTAETIARAGVSAVINAGKFITGDFPAGGANVLLQAGIPMYEISPQQYDRFDDGQEVCITGPMIHTDDFLIPCRKLDEDGLREAYVRSLNDYPDLCYQFVTNSLIFADMDKEWLFEPGKPLRLRTSLQGKEVLAVIRGPHHEDDLEALEPYIAASRPILIGVDGGADALLHCGYTPNIIIGDMDSVSDRALCCGAEIVVHAYTDGRAPGLQKTALYGLSAQVWKCRGTSEDAALLLAYEQGADKIVAVGTHTGILDFLGKGRKGMGSSLLVRMMLGDKLIDAKGYSRLTRSIIAGALQ